MRRLMWHRRWWQLPQFMRQGPVSTSGLARFGDMEGVTTEAGIMEGGDTMGAGDMAVGDMVVGDITVVTGRIVD